MNFGEAWKGYLGECNKETAFAMLDYFYENGGSRFHQHQGPSPYR